MSERTKKFSDALEGLIEEDDMLLMAIQYDCHPKFFKEYVDKTFEGDSKKN